jgi:hypothetical protein
MSDRFYIFLNDLERRGEKLLALSEESDYFDIFRQPLASKTRRLRIKNPSPVQKVETSHAKIVTKMAVPTTWTHVSTGTASSGRHL